MEQARNRLVAVIAFTKSEAYLDFLEQCEDNINAQEVALDDPPKTVAEFFFREQAIGDRRNARFMKNYFEDYKRTMQDILNKLLDDQEQEREEYLNPTTK